MFAGTDMLTACSVICRLLPYRPFRHKTQVCGARTGPRRHCLRHYWLGAFAHRSYPNGRA